MISEQIFQDLQLQETSKSDTHEPSRPYNNSVWRSSPFPGEREVMAGLNSVVIYLREPGAQIPQVATLDMIIQRTVAEREYLSTLYGPIIDQFISTRDRRIQANLANEFYHDLYCRTPDTIQVLTPYLAKDATDFNPQDLPPGRYSYLGEVQSGIRSSLIIYKPTSSLRSDRDLFRVVPGDIRFISPGEFLERRDLVNWLRDTTSNIVHGQLIEFVPYEPFTVGRPYVVRVGSIWQMDDLAQLSPTSLNFDYWFGMIGHRAFVLNNARFNIIDQDILDHEQNQNDDDDDDDDGGEDPGGEDPGGEDPGEEPDPDPTIPTIDNSLLIGVYPDYYVGLFVNQSQTPAFNSELDSLALGASQYGGALAQSASDFVNSQLVTGITRSRTYSKYAPNPQFVSFVYRQPFAGIPESYYIPTDQRTPAQQQEVDDAEDVIRIVKARISNSITMDVEDIPATLEPLDNDLFYESLNWAVELMRVPSVLFPDRFYYAVLARPYLAVQMGKVVQMRTLLEMQQCLPYTIFEPNATDLTHRLTDGEWTFHLFNSDIIQVKATPQKSIVFSADDIDMAEPEGVIWAVHLNLPASEYFITLNAFSIDFVAPAGSTSQVVTYPSNVELRFMTNVPARYGSYQQIAARAGGLVYIHRYLIDRLINEYSMWLYYRFHGRKLTGECYMLANAYVMCRIMNFLTNLGIIGPHVGLSLSQRGSNGDPNTPTGNQTLFLEKRVEIEGMTIEHDAKAFADRQNAQLASGIKHMRILRATGDWFDESDPIACGMERLDECMNKLIGIGTMEIGIKSIYDPTYIGRRRYVYTPLDRVAIMPTDRKVIPHGYTHGYGTPGQGPVYPPPARPPSGYYIDDRTGRPRSN